MRAFSAWGCPSFGVKEAEYTRLTYDLTLMAARTLARLSPGAVFVYVSGHGTDSTERGRQMWARVKGRTENELLALPFRAVSLFRPAFIRAGEGIRSKTRLYQMIYPLLAPLYPLLRAVAPTYVTTTEAIGRAMLRVAREGGPTGAVESVDIERLGRAGV